MCKRISWHNEKIILRCFATNGPTLRNIPWELFGNSEATSRGHSLCSPLSNHTAPMAETNYSVNVCTLSDCRMLLENSNLWEYWTSLYSKKQRRLVSIFCYNSDAVIFLDQCTVIYCRCVVLLFWCISSLPSTSIKYIHGPILSWY